GGSGGIRTRGPREGSPAFQAGALSHSATLAGSLARPASLLLCRPVLLLGRGGQEPPERLRGVQLDVEVVGLRAGALSLLFASSFGHVVSPPIRETNPPDAFRQEGECFETAALLAHPTLTVGPQRRGCSSD